ncbi:MAG: ATP-binding protein [Salinivirgaceae bacterium]|nr:ATP-binding protein [Salinivirgaceae bacterium]
METLIRRHLNRMQNVSLDFVRNTMDKIDWNERLVMIKGQRGVGKTTLMTQRIAQVFGTTDTTKVLYVSLDNIYFSNHSLLEFIERFHSMGGTHLFLDEVHFYKNWNIEIKNAYDEFADMHFVVSGSSLCNLTDGEADLSRRCITYFMPSLSFREYLRMFYNEDFQSVTLNDVLTDGNRICTAVNARMRPLPLFAEYLQYGCFPFQKEGRSNYYARIENIVNNTIDAELPKLRKFDVANSRKIKALLSILASSLPFKLDTVKLATMAEISRNSLLQYLQYLADARLINLLYSDVNSVKRLQKPDKIYLDNPNLLYALSSSQVNEGTLREVFFVNQLSVNHTVEYSKTAADFTIDHQYTIEVGGHSKDGRQIASVADSFIASADEEYVLGNKIPLWLFGFLY